jgi:hypothetical protein
MFTLAQETGDADVFATFQVTACVEPAAHVTAVLGAVTVNGPASLRTLSCMVSMAVPPPPARLSRAVTRNVIVRVVVGSSSPMVLVLDKMSESLGNVRDGEEVGLNDRKIGRFPLSVLGGEAVPRSYSSQE